MPCGPCLLSGKAPNVKVPEVSNFDAPNLPDIEVPEINVPSLPDIPGIELPTGEDDPEEIYSMFQELAAKVEEAEQSVYMALQVSVPEVSIELPRLHPSMFCARAEDGRADPYKSLIAAEEGIEDVAEVASEWVAGLQAAAIAALTSCLIAVAIAFAPFDTLVGALLSTLQAVVINFAGFSRTWRQRCTQLFTVVEAKHHDIIDKLLDSLETVRRQISEVASGVEAVLERMIAEQKPNFDQLQKHEANITTVMPDCELPSPHDLKKPLETVAGMVDEFMEDVKAALPAKMKGHMSSTFAGKLSTERDQFELYAVKLPLGLLFATNLLVALVQVFAVSVATPAPTPGAAAESGERTGSASALALNLPPNFVPVVMPALVQILFALAQTALAGAFSLAACVCDLVNSAIEGGEAQVNDHGREKVKDVTDRLFSTVLAEVRQMAEAFFPKFKECLEHLRPILETAAKASALAKQGNPF